MAVYDSARTREAARLMKRLAYSLNTDVKPCIRSASEHTEALRGRTAQAMEERLSQLIRFVVSLEDELEVLAHQVNAYADALERADDELAKML